MFLVLFVVIRQKIPFIYTISLIVENFFSYFSPSMPNFRTRFQERENFLMQKYVVGVIKRDYFLREYERVFAMTDIHAYS
jgi:hypothetical protein